MFLKFATKKSLTIVPMSVGVNFPLSAPTASFKTLVVFHHSKV